MTETTDSRVRKRLYKIVRTYKVRFQPLHERIKWFHYETRNRSYMLRAFGQARLP